MKPKQPVLVATDFSPAAALAVERGARLAKAWRCPLHLLHVFNPLDWEQARERLSGILSGRDPSADNRRALEALGKEIATRLDLRVERSTVTTGRASTAIAEHAREIDAGLIVVGIRGEGLMHELALGGTAVKVLRRSPSPVLVVRRPPVEHYRSIAIATDLSETSSRALRAVVSMFPDASRAAIHASVLHCEGRMRLSGAAPEEIERCRANALASAQRGLEAFLTDADYQAAPAIDRVVRPGHPAAVLLEELAHAPHDLLVLGRHGKSVLDEQLLGSITLNLLHHAPCDVLLVP